MSTAVLDHASAEAGNSPMREIVYGAAAIGAVIGEPNVRRVFYMLSKNQIPGQFQIGTRHGLSVPTFRRAVHGKDS